MVYILTVLIMGMLDYGLTILLTHAGLLPITSKGIATVIGFFGNFLLRRFLVFPERRIVAA